MNSLSVSSVCDHSSSVYLDPTSTGTVRHPATDLKYSMLCGRGGNELNTTVTLQHRSRKKDLLIQDSSSAQKYIMCTLLGVLVYHQSCESEAVCQLSATSSEREDSEGYRQWRGRYITLWCHTLESVNQACCDN